MDFPDDEDFENYENEWDAMDSMQAEPTSSKRPTTAPTAMSASKTATEFKAPSRPTPTGHSVSRRRRRSNEPAITKPRWTPYPAPQVQSSGSASLRTENESSQPSLPPSSGTHSLDLDGFEIAPATASKLDKFRFTPSPEKKAHVALPDLPKGAIDLTSPVKKPFGGAKMEEGADVATVDDNAIQVDADQTIVAETPGDAQESGKETTKEEKPKVEEMPLSAEQQKVLEMVMQGQSLFFTGSAGTGKSFLLKKIIEQLRLTVSSHKGRLVKKNVAVTASTGIAGVSIGGVTLHSWAGIGIAPGDPDFLVKKMKREDAQRRGANTAYKRWNETDVLIIDEISMIDGRFWDKLEELGRLVRNSSKPFGGIQLVLCGDFFQLPPVPDRHDRTSVFAFQAKTWNRCIPKVIALTQVFRQKAGSFVQMLNEARTGTLSSSSSRKFAMLARPVKYDDGIEATELYPVKLQAEDANQKRLKALKGTTEMYVSRDVPGHKTEGSLHTHEAAVKLLDQYCKAPAVLELKVGCQVMLITNIKGGEGGLFNGSLGKIIGFERESTASTTSTAAAEKPKVVLTDAEKEEREVRAAKQAAAFSTTGWDTDDEDEVIPELPPVVEKPIDMSKGVPLRRWDVDSKNCLWPLVKFTNGMEMLVKPFEFDILSAKGTMEARRVQIPLINSWAISIHKSQGMTLPRMKVDLAKSFEKGQAYVALSRATSMDTIEVQNFHPSKVFAHPTVIAWSKTLAML